MIIITGGAGFIGSNLIESLNKNNIDNILVIDSNSTKKNSFFQKLSFNEFIDKKTFITTTLNKLNPTNISSIIHLGACSSTTEQNIDYLNNNNTDYTITLAKWSIRNKIRFIYASSAATYGDGRHGFDDEAKIENLTPLNPYGWSKQNADLWLKNNNQFNSVVGLKFFNVYGKYEDYKGSMQSMVSKATNQIKKTGKIKLFKSHVAEYSHGNQIRDFIYVDDCIQIITWLLDNPNINGLFNCGSGIENTWNDLANIIFKTLNITPNIEYIDMPDSIRNQYQYYTKATMKKLKNTGCPIPRTTLQNGIKKYIESIK